MSSRLYVIEDCKSCLKYKVECDGFYAVKNANMISCKKRKLNKRKKRVVE